MHEAALAEIRSAISRILPVGIATSAGSITGPNTPLAAAELPPTARMSPRRYAEYSAGRAHARQALGQLGVDSPVVGVGPGRAPRWPAGFVGSISHAGDLVLAVAAPSSRIRAIGVDVEQAVPLDPDLVERVCRPGELAAPGPTAGSPARTKLIFSAKESVYKCMAPATGVFLEFEDVELLFEAGVDRFRARGHGPARGLIVPATLTGAFAVAGGYWLTAAWQGP